MSYKQRLKRMKTAYEGSRKTAEEMFEDFPIGVFVMKLKSAELAERSDESLYIMTKYIVTDEEEKGRQFTDFQNINEEHLEFVHRYFTEKGVESPEMEDLEDALEKLSEAGITVKMRVTSKDGYINGRVLAVVETEVLDTDTTDDDDDPDPDPDPEPEGLTKESFLELCERCGIDIPAKVQKKDIEDIAEFINDTYDVDAKEMDEKDIIIFESLDVELKNTPVEKAKKKAKSKDDDSEDETIKILKEVCAGNGIDFEKDDTAEQLGERLSDGYKWFQEKDGLTDEQVAAMRKADVKVKD